MTMSELQLFALTKSASVPMPISENTAVIHDLYDGLPLGVYSALRSFEQNKFLGLDDHIARTKQSIQLLGWDYQLDEVRLRQGIHEVLSAYPKPEAKMRFDVLAEEIQIGDEETRLLVGVAPFAGIPDLLYEQGVKVGFASTLNREMPLAKTAVFVNQRKGVTIGTEEAYERLLVNEAGEILECTSANFYAVQKGKIYTANEGILEGITRKIILEIIESLSIPIALEAPRVAEIDQFEESGLSSSSRAMIPIVQIGGQAVGNGRPGPIMQKILIAYNAYVAGAIKTAV